MPERDWKVIESDCVEAMRAMAEASVDAVVCDPPYGLEFMGKTWDAFRTTDRTARWSGERSGAAGSNRGDVTERWSGGDGRSIPSGRTSFGGQRPTTARCNGCGKRDAFRNDHGCTEGWTVEPVDPNSAPPSMLAFQAWSEQWAREALRVLKPGGHLLAFGGTRTYHRLACAIEDAGFEIRDTIAWMYGSGFPKSLDVGKAITATQREGGSAMRDLRRARLGDEYAPTGQDDPNGATFAAKKLGWTPDGDRTPTALTPDAERWHGWGTALKPAHEPIAVARKPLAGNVAQTVLEHGTGALNVDGCRIGFAGDGDEAESKGKNRHADFGSGPRANAVFGTDHRARGEHGNYDPPGRWPANVVLDPEAAAMLDAQTGDLGESSGRRQRGESVYANGQGFANSLAVVGQDVGYGDSGGASRFFFIAQWRPEEGCPTPDPVSIAARCSCPPSAPDDSAQSGVATSGSRVEKPRDGYPARSTSATPRESGASSASDTPRTRAEHLPARKPAAPTPTDGHASDAAPNPPTGTTTTTPVRSTCGGSAGPAMSASTPPLSDHGVPGSLAGERFRYCAKASSAERNALELSYLPRARSLRKRGQQDAADRWRQRARNRHPTVKPVEFMRWLVRLVTPPGGLVLDPFAGSGTTGAAAVLEGFRFVGIEREAEYAAIARARIAWWVEHPDGMELVQRLEAEKQRKAVAEAGQLDLFG